MKTELVGESDLGPLQREVLDFAWEHPGCTVRDCRDHFQAEGSRDYAYTTIQTVFDSLHRKKLVRRRKDKTSYRYTTVKSRSGLLAQGLNELLARFGFNAAPVASCLVDALETSPEELDALVQELRERGHVK